MGKSLSHLSSEVTQQQNTAGVTTPILEIDPEDGTLLRLLNRVATGSAEGLPLIMKLFDDAGNQLPADTELILQVQRPTDDEPISVSVKEDNIAAWNGLSTAEQRNEENIDSVKVELKGSRINIRDRDTAYLAINSSEVVDWSQGSEVYFMREGVQERPFEG